MNREIVSSDSKRMDTHKVKVQFREEKGSSTTGTQYEQQNSRDNQGGYPVGFSSVRRAHSSLGLLTLLYKDGNRSRKEVEVQKSASINHTENQEDNTSYVLKKEEIDENYREKAKELDENYRKKTKESADALKDLRANRITKEKYLQIDREAVAVFNLWNKAHSFQDNSSKKVDSASNDVAPHQTSEGSDHPQYFSSDPPPIE